jgi:hypothetical protein
VEDLTLCASEQKFKEHVIVFVKFQQVDRVERNLTSLMQIDWHLLHNIRVEVVVEDLVTGQHKAMESLLINKHLLELYSLVAHTCIVRHAIWGLGDTTGFDLGLD